MDLQSTPQEDYGVNIEVSNGPIYISPRTHSSNTHTINFFNTASITVPITNLNRQVYVKRGIKYIPMLILPDVTDNNTVTFFFKKPETGFII